MNSVRIQPRAQAEAEEALVWYEKQFPGLGVEFILDIDQAIARVAETPLAYEPVYGGARRVLCRKFPFAIYFLIEPDRVEVVAIIHQQRAPESWQSRLPR